VPRDPRIQRQAEYAGKETSLGLFRPQSPAGTVVHPRPLPQGNQTPRKQPSTSLNLAVHGQQPVYYLGGSSFFCSAAFSPSLDSSFFVSCFFISSFFCSSFFSTLAGSSLGAGVVS
jgi:hypothetical protein